MPQVSFICPDEVMWTVQDDGIVTNQVPVQDCLDCSVKRPNRACHWDFADLTLRRDRDAAYASFNPSKMLGCPREHWYRINTDYPVDPGTRHAMVRGTRTHAALEVPHPDILAEITVVRYLKIQWKKKTLEIPISVRPDKVYPQHGLIHDDKTRGYLQTREGRAVEPEHNPEYAFQLAVGAWAWAAPAYTVGPQGVNRNPEPIVIEQGQVIYRDSTKQIKQMYPIFEFDWLEGEMRRRIQPYMALYDDNVKAPPLEGPETWRCKTCPHHKTNFGDCDSHIGTQTVDQPVPIKATSHARAGGTVSRVRVIR